MNEKPITASPSDLWMFIMSSGVEIRTPMEKGQPAPYNLGDSLWVQVRWRTQAIYDNDAPRDIPDTAAIATSVDAPPEWNTQLPMLLRYGRWRPPLHLPRRLAPPVRLVVERVWMDEANEEWVTECTAITINDVFMTLRGSAAEMVWYPTSDEEVAP